MVSKGAFLRTAWDRGVGCLVCALLLISLQGCVARRGDEEKGLALAQVGNRVLYAASLPLEYRGLEGADSVRQLRQYVEDWVRMELLATYAERELGGELPRLERQVGDFRARLYSDAFIRLEGLRRIDTAISQHELEECYRKNRGYFALEEPLVRLVFVKVLASSPYLSELRQQIKALDTSEVRLQEFSALTMRAGVLPDYLPTTWVLLSRVVEQLPGDFTTQGRVLRHVEVQDEGVVYLLEFFDWIAPGGYKPFEMVVAELRSIVLQERLSQWRQERVQILLQQGLNSGFVKMSVE